MKDEDLFRMMVVAVYRCSTGDQENSIQRQREACQAFAKQHGMIIVKEVVLEAKSATQGEQMAFLDEIVQMKIEGVLEFSGVLFADFSRISRIMDDAERFYLDCRDAGLKIVTQKDGLISGKQAWIKKGIAGQASEEFGANHSAQVNGGVMLSMARGLIPHSLAAPYAVDRLFISSSNEPLCILRRLPGKITQKLSPVAPHTVVEEFVGRARRRCVLRQGNDRIEFIPGDPAAVEVVRFIYRSFFREVEPDGCHRIARMLNDKGVPSPKGKKWHTSCVKSILMNSSLTGVGVACKLSCGVHSVRQPGCPIQLPEPRRPGFITPREEGEPRRKRKRVPYQRRPVSDWYLVRLPKLFDFLGDPHLRRRAKAYRRQLRHRQGRKSKTGRRTGRWNPQYFLSNLISTGPAGVRMIGVPTMRDKKGLAASYRYYYASRATNCPQTGDPLSARLRADHVEDAFLAALEQVLSAPEVACERVKEFVQKKYEERVAAKSDLTKLVAEREAKEDHLKMILRLGPRAQKLGGDSLGELETRLNELDQLIRAAQTGLPTRPVDISGITASIKKQFGELRQIVRDRPLMALRRIAQVFAGRIAFDGITRRLDLEITLPEWAMKKQSVILDCVRVPTTHDIMSDRFTNRDSGVVLMISTCLSSVGIGKAKPCLTCTRALAA